MADNRGRRLVAAVIVLVGVILLIAALLMPWYTEKVSLGGGDTTVNFFPGLPSQSGSVSWSCSGGASCPSNETSYSGFIPALTNVGNIAEAGFFLLIVGIIVGVIAAAFGFMSRTNSRRAMPATTLGLLAMILALIAPIMFAALLPGAVSNDISSTSPQRYGSSSGPWSSFIGSTTFTTPVGSASFSWGPGVGWYLGIAAFVVLLIGVVLFLMSRKEPASPAPATAPAPSAAPPSGTTPPTQ